NGTNGEEDKLNWKIHVCSENNFPTAAGLASSAAGYACLVCALGKLYGVEGDLSDIARSIYGGFVVWNKGVLPDGSDSCATQIATESHWPQLRALIFVSDQEKQIGSTSGMGTTVNTSELLQKRIETIEPKVERITEAIRNRDFTTFAEITMKVAYTFDAGPNACLYLMEKDIP
ncbi:hypothetical protein KUTeg_019318, partial [Tegillarca granosa]